MLINRDGRAGLQESTTGFIHRTLNRSNFANVCVMCVQFVHTCAQPHRRRLSKVILQRRLSGTRNSNTSDVLLAKKNQETSCTALTHIPFSFACWFISTMRPLLLVTEKPMAVKAHQKKRSKRKKKNIREQNRCFCFLNPNIFKKKQWQEALQMHGEQRTELITV